MKGNKIIMMNERIKEEWCTLLEEGELEQISGSLTTLKGGFCCLGVLCEIARTEGVVELDNGMYNYEESYLPQTVMEWSGLTKRNPFIKSEESHLANINDSGKNFPNIAKLIRKEL